MWKKDGKGVSLHIFPDACTTFSFCQFTVSIFLNLAKKMHQMLQRYYKNNLQSRDINCWRKKLQNPSRSFGLINNLQMGSIKSKETHIFNTGAHFFKQPGLAMYVLFLLNISWIICPVTFSLNPHLPKWCPSL